MVMPPAGMLMVFALPVPAAALPPAPTGVQVSHEQGIEFVTVGDPNNPAYQGGPLVFGQPYLGRGSVGYNFRIGRTEVTTAQWLEFLNTVDTFDSALASQLEPTPGHWGAVEIAPAPPGQRWVLGSAQNSDRIAVGGITWRAAAYFCNWLHNEKSALPQAIQRGAYDSASFGYNSSGQFTDQLTRSPGARFWIPSLDEWLKASHYDPSHASAVQGGWWDYPYLSNQPPVSGFPGESNAQSGADLDGGILTWLSVPLGSYPDAHSPYGLLDVSGGASEMTEEAVGVDGPAERLAHGSFVGGGLGTAEYYDLLWRPLAGFAPDRSSPVVGVRIAAAVPGPSMFSLCCGVALLACCQRRRT